MKVAIVHPSFNPWYYTFYLEGLIRAGYSLKFKNLLDHNLKRYVTGRNDFFLYEITERGKTRRVLLGAEDFNYINEEYVSLSDVYGKVNLKKECFKEGKIVPIGPSFGISSWHRPGLLLQMVKQRVAPWPHIRQSLRREGLHYYEKIGLEDGSANHIFYLNFPWKKHKEVTAQRKILVEHLKEMHVLGEIEFEGGFSKRRFGYHAGLEQVSATKLYNSKSYLRAQVKGKMAINTPAVHGCLGWKLGEYFALGRAVVSLPISNLFPVPIEHGKHIHFFENEETVDEEIKKLRLDVGYLQYLQKNTNEYYNQYLRPDVVINRMNDMAFQK